MKKVHFIGIGGTGLSAIARILVEKGYTVSGSDRTLSSLALELAELGVTVFEGHAADNIAGADLVIRSSAVSDDNPEVQASLVAGIPVLKRADFLAQLIAGQDCIAIAGTHGKTTTTAMIAWVLTRLGQDPSYIIGGVSKNLGRNAHAGQGKYFVIEADEYDNMFLGLEPTWAVVTIVEHDHPDCFPTPADYQAAFEAFVKRIKPGGGLLVCSDNPGASALISACPSGRQTHTFGASSPAEYSAEAIFANARGGSDFSLSLKSTQLAPQMIAQVGLQLPGLHMVRNAAAVLALIHQLGLSVEEAVKALAEFSSTGRRFDLRGTVQSVTFYDDYAHHPTEIRATLEAARQRYPTQTIWAVWQPHTYSRTRTLQNDFAAAFTDADRVLVTEIYAAREKYNNFSSLQVVQAMDHPSARFCPTLTNVAETLLAELKAGDVVLVLSAGDADQISDQVLQELKKREVQNG
jgi:UDP-N-acetylmuramate--alanine ligase